MLPFDFADKINELDISYDEKNSSLIYIFQFYNANII